MRLIGCEVSNRGGKNMAGAASAIVATKTTDILNFMMFPPCFFMTIEISECYMLLGSKTKTYHLTWSSVCRFVANLCGFPVGDR
jgi:hypothetical protein